MTAPNFLLALAAVASSDLVVALPRHLAVEYAPRFGAALAEPPIKLAQAPLYLIAPAVALKDEGVAWLYALIREAAAEQPAKPARRAPQPKRAAKKKQK